MAGRVRHQLVASCTRRVPHHSLPYRHPTPDDLPALAALMLDAYQGTIDDDGETLDDALTEVASYFNLESVPPILDCSFIALDGDRATSASLIRLWNATPLAAYVYTGRGWKNRGLAAALLQLSINALARNGYQSLTLWVTAGNAPAEYIYRKLGFREVTTPGS
ncbi:MAG: N-acetyltransferase family protein [Dehalococcoidia bacterium]